MTALNNPIARIGVLSSLRPRPNTKDTMIFNKALTEALQGILSYQSQRFGFIGMIATPQEYILMDKQL